MGIARNLNSTRVPVNKISGKKTGEQCPNCGEYIVVRVNGASIIAWCPGCLRRPSVGNSESEAIKNFQNNKD